VSRHPAATGVPDLGELAPLDHGHDCLAIDPQDRRDFIDRQGDGSVVKDGRSGL
jgi:hypothetical protein